MKRRLSNQGRILFAAIAILCGAMTEAQGGTITATQLISGCGSTGGTPLQGVLTKTFNTVCTMDIVFTVTNSGGLNSIGIRETAVNISGQTWFDFHMQLGFGVGTGFTPATNCGVGFATLPLPTSTVFTQQGVSSGAIDWEGGGTVAPGGNVGFTFNLNIQDLSPCIPVGSQMANGFTFTLRETPTVPEPATMLLLGTGLAGVAIKTRKRLKRRNSR